jgi:hypothetical protein
VAKVLEAQAALEAAVLETIRGLTYQGTRYNEANCDRTFDDRPHPRALGPVWVSVWDDNSVKAGELTHLKEEVDVRVTITLRHQLPFDRWVEERDQLSDRMGQVVAAIARDSWNYVITNRANTLAGFGDGQTKDIGYRKPLHFENSDGIQPVTADWFHGEPPGDGGGEDQVGIMQTAYFTGATRYRRLSAL